MRIAAHVKSTYQCGMNEWQDYIKTYIFEDTVTIAEILKVTGQKEISSCNLSIIEEQGATK
jgi:hypothetical protein